MILINDFTREPPELRQKILNAVESVLNSGQYILGKSVAEFENAWSSRTKRKFGVGVGNGLDALVLSLRALGIGPGDEVITTGMTALATLLSILSVGATPVLADIDPDTALLDINSAEAQITKRTKAIILVHLYGQLKYAREWSELCENNGIHLIEDCAQAHDAKEQNRIAGSIGVCGAFSFYPTKNLGAIGDAGLIVTDNPDVYHKTRSLRNYGQRDRYVHDEVGINSRLDEIQAAILTVKMPFLEAQTERRRETARRYLAEINNSKVTKLAQPSEHSAHSYHLFVVRCKNREHLSKQLAEKGIATISHYPIPAHHQPALKGKVRTVIELPHLEAHAYECLSLPIHPFMNDNEIDQVIYEINNYHG
jgi:dTDP-4-amino-4,6-dideoxygalactose transaminase